MAEPVHVFRGSSGGAHCGSDAWRLILQVFLDPLDPLDRMTSSKANRGSLALKVPLG